MDVGQTWGRFELRGRLGAGAFGEVFLAFDPSLGHEVALKVLALPDPSPRQLARFEREGAIAARLDHPGLVRVFSVGEHAGRPYVVFEHVRGCRTLAEAVGGLSQLEALEAVIAAAEALGYAHAQGVVHRDVKPDNLLLDLHGRLRVADFGAAVLAGVEKLTLTGALVGTPLVMSPEQLAGSGSGEQVTPAADVWALGVVLYWLLTRSYPFEGSTLLELSSRVSAGRYVPIRELAPHVPPAVEAVVATALQVSPGARYPTGAELAAALRDALEGAPRSGGSTLSLAAAAVVVGLGIGVGWRVWSRPAGEPPPPTRVVSSTPSPAATPTPTRSPVSVATTPEQRAAIEALMRSARYADVIRRVDPLDHAQRFMRGLAHMERGAVEEAVADLRAVAGVGVGGMAEAAEGLLRFAQLEGQPREVRRAKRVLRKACKHAPEHQEVLLQWARVAMVALDYEPVSELLARMERTHPGHWFAATLRAMRARLLGDLDDAARWLTAARERLQGPEPVSLWIEACALEAARDDLPALRRLVDQGVAAYPRGYALRHIRALLFLSIGDEEQSKRDLAQLQERYPNLLAVYREAYMLPRDLGAFFAHQRALALTRRHLRSGRLRVGPFTKVRLRALEGAPWEELKRAFDRLAEAAPPKRQHAVAMWRIHHLRIRGRFEEGVKVANPLLGLPGRSGFGARFQRGLCLRRLRGREAEARAALVALARADPDGPYGLAAGAVLKAQASPKEAIELAQRALKLQPSFFDARISLAFALARSGKLGPAQRVFNRVRGTVPDLPRLQLRMGLAIERKLPKLAFQHLHRFVRLYRGRGRVSSWVLSPRAWTALRGGRYLLAQADFEELMRRQPKLAQPRVGLGLARLGLGRPAEAQREWRRARRLKAFDQTLRMLPVDHRDAIRAALR